MYIYKLPYLRSLFSKRSFITNVLTLSTGIILGQGIALISAPILTRLYAPGDFGILEVYASLLGTFSVVASLRYSLAIPLPESDAAAANIFILSMAIVVLMALFTGLMTWFFGSKLLILVKAQAMIPYAWLLPLGVLGAGTYQVLSFWGIRQKAFGTIAWTKISQSLGRATTQTILGWLSMGPVGLLIGDMIGHCSGSTRLALTSWRKDKSAFKRIELSAVWEALRRYKQFPLYSISGFLYFFGMKIPSLLLAAFYGLKVLGWFALAQWVIVTPLSLIGASVSQVYVGELAEVARQSPIELSKLFVTTLRTLFIVAIVVVPLIVLGAPHVVSSVFGQTWHRTGVYIQVLSIMFFFQMVSFPLGGTLDVLERQDLGLAREVFRAILMGAAVPLAAFLNQPPVIAILFYAVAAGIVNVFGIAIYWQAISTYKAGLASEKLV